MAIVLNGTTGITSPKVNALDLELNSVNVVERGSNANGEYVRFADGTQICTMPQNSLPTATVAVGSGYQGATGTTFVFPASFLSSPAIAYESGYTGTGARGWATELSVSTTQVQLISQGFMNTSNVRCRPVAIGRWF